MNDTKLFEKAVLGETDVNPNSDDKGVNDKDSVKAGEAQKDDKAPAPEKEEKKEEKINIDEIVNKALEKKEKAMLRSIFKQQGVADDQIDEKIAEYKEQLAGKKEDQIAVKDAELKELQATLEKSKAVILDREIMTSVIAAGVDPVKAELFVRLVDREGLTVGDDFKVNAEAINKAISSVLEKVPEFKLQKENGLKFGTQKQVTDTNNTRKSYSLRDGIESKY